MRWSGPNSIGPTPGEMVFLIVVGTALIAGLLAGLQRLGLRGW